MNRQSEVKDIAPDLLNKIESTYKDLVENDEVLSSLLKKNADKLAKAQDEQDFAAKIAECLSEAYKEHLSGDTLPNGQMYYNIANRIIPPTMTGSYQQISDYCYAAQSALNENAGISIKAQRAPINTDRINGIVNRVSQKPFDEIDWILKAPIENFCRSIVDDHKKANADFHYRSGLRPRIIRKTDGKCCKWCLNLAGTYEYSPGMDREVFRRHENCGCTVEYDPGNGSKRRQNVWDKSWSFVKNPNTKKRFRFRLDIQFFAGKERAEKWGDNWQEVDLDEFLERWAKNAEVRETEQKVEYQTPGSPYIVSVDKNGDYVRLMDTRLPGKHKEKKYVDADGKDAHNVVENGKTRGRSKSEWQAATHFKFKKRR